MRMPFETHWLRYFRLLHAVEQKGIFVNRTNMAIKHAGALDLLKDKVLLGPRIASLENLKPDQERTVLFRSAIVTTKGIGVMGFVLTIESQDDPEGWAVVPLTPTSSFVPYAEWPATVQAHILRRLVAHIRHLTAAIRDFKGFRDFV